MLTSCDSKQLTHLQVKLSKLEEKIAEVSMQRDLLQQQLEKLNAKDLTP
jgi:TolA-binding protein